MSKNNHNYYVYIMASVSHLVYYEHFRDINDAIKREKELKGWRREKKVKLIEGANFKWKDIYGDLIK